MDSMEQEKEVNEGVKKLELDKPLDFKYHAAYIAYSKIWDDNLSQDTRSRLNNLMESVTDTEEDYSNFYEALTRFRKDAGPGFIGRGRIRTQSKKEWKRNEAKAARTSRYRSK